MDANPPAWQSPDPGKPTATTEERLRLLQAAVETAANGIVITDDTGAVIWANGAFFALNGYPPEEIMGRRLGMLRSGRHGDQVYTEMWATLRRGERWTGELVNRRKDGSLYDVYMTISPVRAATGAPTHFIAIQEDISAKKETEQALARSTLEIHDLYNQAPCGYCSLDENGRVILVNKTCATWLGYTEQELMGRFLGDLVAEKGREPFASQFAALQRSPSGVQNLETEFHRRDGTSFSVMMSSVPVLDDHGRFLCTRTTLFDITERLKLEREFREAAQVAGAANRAKSEFLANMSHEIRTPLNAILGHAQLLEREPDLPQAIREQVGVINRSGVALLSLLNSVLELSKIELGGPPDLLPEPFEPASLLGELVALFRERASAKGLVLSLELAPGSPESIEGDKGKIRQVVANLLGNAIKFTTQGGISVRAAVISAGDFMRLLVEVEDTGVGIDKDEISQLFRPFTQTSSGRESRAGTGLGLCLGRQYARAMGGDLTVESQLGIGSTFRLELPVKAVPAKIGKTAVPMPLRPRANLASVRVLVVDDQKDNRERLERFLAGVGFITHTAGGGGEALEMVKSWKPHLVLMDTGMPGITGQEAIRRIRADGSLAQPRILMISASTFKEDREDALIAGADDFVGKPFRSEALLEKICALCGLPAAGPAGLPEFDSPPTPQAGRGGIAGRLPRQLLLDLRAALIVGDMDRLASLLDEVGCSEPTLQRKLRPLLNEFDLDPQQA